MTEPRQKRFAVLMSVLAYGMFAVACLSAFFAYHPQWALMDDTQSRGIAEEYTAASDKFAVMHRMIAEDKSINGRFRPLYYVRLVFVYSWFHDHAFAFNLFEFASGMFSLFLWGLVFRRLYSDKNISSVFMVLVLPLSAFVFTPFWNIFYFFSIQERFIVFFAPIALLCFMEARRGGLWYVFGGLFACAGMLLGKETSLAFFAAVIAAAVFSAVHDRRFRDFFPIALAAVAMFAYAMFIKSIISGYSQRYAQGLSVAGLLAKIAAVPAVVKLIVLVSVIALLFALFRRRSNDPDPWWTVCPFFCIAYAAILLPWGYPPYLMSALGPFLVGMFFAPLYALRKNRIVFGAGIFFMVVVIAAVTAGVIVPNIEKKASISQVVAWIGAHRGEISGVYAPKPLIEATFAFEKMTRVPFILVGGDRLDAESLSRASHLIVERDAVVVRLQGVEAVGPVYVNSHWVVYALEKNDAVDREFLHQFTETAIQKIKYAIKKL